MLPEYQIGVQRGEKTALISRRRRNEAVFRVNALRKNCIRFLPDPPLVPGIPEEFLRVESAQNGSGEGEEEGEWRIETNSKKETLWKEEDEDKGIKKRGKTKNS